MDSPQSELEALRRTLAELTTRVYRIEQRLGRPHEAGPQEKILRRVARHRELGKDHEVGAGAPGLLDAREDQIMVPLQVSHGRIDLRQSQLHRSFSLTVENQSRLSWRRRQVSVR